MKKGTGYYQLDLRWPKLTRQSNRMPDVFATMLVQLINDGYCQVQNVNQILHQYNKIGV
jgi:hypothetical protein